MMQDTSDDSTTERNDDTEICEFCTLPIPKNSTNETDSNYCCSVCEEHAETEGELVPLKKSEYINTGIDAIDSSLPQGFPRDSLIFISSEPGTRGKSVIVEGAWRRLEKGEKVLLLACSDPPKMLLKQFIALEWNVFPYLENGDLKIIDCYSEGDTSQDLDSSSNAWNSHIDKCISSNKSVVSDPGQASQLKRKIDATLEYTKSNESISIFIDSITVMGSKMRDVTAYKFLKTMRSEYCKNRGFTIFANANYSGSGEEFPHEMEHIFDGIIDLSLNPQIIPGILIKEVRIRKIRAAMSVRDAKNFEIIEEDGMKLIKTENKREDSIENEDAKMKMD